MEGHGIDEVWQGSYKGSCGRTLPGRQSEEQGEKEKFPKNTRGLRKELKLECMQAKPWLAYSTGREGEGKGDRERKSGGVSRVSGMK